MSRPRLSKELRRSVKVWSSYRESEAAELDRAVAQSKVNTRGAWVRQVVLEALRRKR